MHGKSTSSTGRPVSKFWSYFTEVLVDSIKKQKCNRCEMLISSKATRLKVHLEKCQGVYNNDETPECVENEVLCIPSSNPNPGEGESAANDPENITKSTPRVVRSEFSKKIRPKQNQIGFGRSIYQKIASLESKVCKLESELRIVRQKLHSYEVNCVSNIVNQFKEQKFSLTLNPIEDNRYKPNDVELIVEDDNETPNDLEFEEPEAMNNDSESSWSGDNSGSGASSNNRKTGTRKNAKRKRSNKSKPTNESPSKIGRKTDTIWDNFNISADSTGKRLTFCKICESNVSARPSRLRSHLQNCGRKNSSSIIKKEPDSYGGEEEEDNVDDDDCSDSIEISYT